MCVLYVEDEGGAGLGGGAGLPGLALHRQRGEGLVVGAALRHQRAGVLCNYRVCRYYRVCRLEKLSIAVDGLSVWDRIFRVT